MTPANSVRPVQPWETYENTDFPEIRNARVLSRASDQIVLDIAGEKHRACKAFSCFVEPLPDDRVICSRDETGMLYILGIIDRKNSQNVTISYPANTDMVCTGGSLNLRAKNALSVASQDLNFFSDKVVHKSREAVFALDETTVTGYILRASFKTVQVFSRMINTMARQVIERFQGYIRNTEDNDQVRAGQMTRRTDGMYTMDSKYTIMVSDKDTKIDGERIHMG